MGIREIADNMPEIASTIFVFVEGESDAMLSVLGDVVRALGGSATRCDSAAAKRLMVCGSHKLFDKLSKRSSVPAANLVSSALGNFYASETPSIETSSDPISFARTKVMGVLNVTPDSFSDGGAFINKEDAVRRAFEIADQGADLIDIGGESTRPFSEPVSEKEEMDRVLPVLEEVAPSLCVPISIDTMKPAVARKAVELGARMVNDVSGLRNREMIDTVAELDVPVVVMHMRGIPKTMQVDVRYDDIVGDIMLYMAERMGEAIERGVREEKIMLDPGIGFGKELHHNLEIIRRLREFRSLGRPIVIGPSRKGFIGKVLGLPSGERLEGSLAGVAASILNGANIVRVHDVKETVRVCRMLDAILLGMNDESPSDSCGTSR
ncbi:MAG: dihydropteroate synthase [Methanomassiliicoccales archaeon]|nr:dihydropteroate synthase [Methanomassiliicoccales archaeon]